MAHQILLIDDDALLRRSLTFDLTKAGFRVTSTDSAEDGLRRAAQDLPDLVLLDIGLPGMDGLHALHHFRERFAMPVVFLTARRMPFDEVAALELGAHDYITKPFDTDVLVARVRAILRRAESQPERPAHGRLTVGDLAIDPASRTVRCCGREIALTPREFDLLYILAANAGQPVPIESLLQEVWGTEHAVEPQVIYVHIRWLREKLEEDANRPRRLVTVHRIGYKLVPWGP